GRMTRRSKARRPIWITICWCCSKRATSPSRRCWRRLRSAWASRAWPRRRAEAARRADTMRDVLQQEETAARSGVLYSPYRTFSRDDWARLRADTPMTLVPRDLAALSGLIEELSIAVVEQTYLPLSR